MIFSTSLYQLHFLFPLHLDGAMWLVLTEKLWIEYVTSRLIELGVGGPFLYSHIFVYSDLVGYNIGGVFLGLWNIVWSREHPRITEQWADRMWVHNKLCYTTGIWVIYPTLTIGTPGGTMVKKSAYQSRRCKRCKWPLGREDPLEKEMATHSSILAWQIPWTEEPGRSESMGLKRVGHSWSP